MSVSARGHTVSIRAVELVLGPSCVDVSIVDAMSVSGATMSVSINLGGGVSIVTVSIGDILMSVSVSISQFLGRRISIWGHVVNVGTVMSVSGLS